MSQCVLKVKADRNVQKHVEVRSTGEELQLCCVDRQTSGTLVQIFERYRGERIQNAYTFMYNENCYCLTVNGNFLKLEEDAPSNSGPISEQCWFEKMSAGSGEYYILQSVVNPWPYLSLSGNGSESQYTILELTDHADKSVLVTDEEVQ